MARIVVQSTRARGSLAVDPKDPEGAGWPERILAWDEDATTLAIAAARALPHAPRAFVGPGIDAEAFAVALDVANVTLSGDPLASAKAVDGPTFAIGAPDATSVVAALVDEGEGPEPTAPKDVSPPPRMVSALRAHQESRSIAPSEPMPDTPMGAYVPWGTWVEDLPARLRLLAQRCDACGRVAYPPRGACLVCRGRAFTNVPLPDEARVYALTRIGRGGAPSEFALEQAQVGAYWVAVVEWPSHGVRVSARLADVDEEGPAIGGRVRPVVRRLFTQEGRTRYGLKFAP